MVLTPRSVGLAIGSLLCVTTLLYTKQWEAGDNSAATATQSTSNVTGRWGVIDSEFDWCERNYASSHLVAEPFNSATSAFYPLLAAYGWHRHRGQIHSRWLTMLLLLASLMGVGSVLFHATLRYPMQLLDELPLYGLAVLAAAVLQSRHQRRADVVPAVAVGLTLVQAVLLVASPRSSSLHAGGRIFMSVTFAGAFLAVFVQVASAAAELDCMRKRGETPDGEGDGSYLLVRLFAWFLVAIVSWILDLAWCPALQTLPIEPQLHALGWHLGTCLGLWYIFILLLSHQHAVRDGNPITVHWPRLGLPYVDLVDAQAHLKGRKSQ